jgi:1,4-dihydroxy-2-naphthoyl-CoA hydrolase
MKSIWFRKPTKEECQLRGKNSMVEHIGIEITEIGEDFIKGTMPVDHRTHQPRKILHGGASVVLAESLASLAGNYCVDVDRFICVGLEINANHIRPVTEGFVEGVSRPVHLGKSTQVWNTEIRQNGKIVCFSRMTLSVLDKERTIIKN